MKNKVKLLLTSIATIIMTASLVVGATFALFTSEDTVNVAVTSGKVNVSARVNDASVVMTSRDEVMTNGYFANGGQAVWSEDSVSLSLITPGDKIEFDINVYNDSNVKALYRTIVKCDSGLELFAGLTISIDYGADGQDVQVFDGLTAYGAWTLMDAVVSETVVETVKVTIEFPYLEVSQNEYQGLSTAISFSVEAVQANATVTDNVAGQGETLIYTSNDLKLVSAKASKGYTFKNETIKLCDDIDLSANTLSRSVEKNWTPIANFQGTFDGQGHTISNLISIEDNKAGLIGMLSGGVIKNVTVNNAYVSAGSYAGAIVGMGYTGSIENCHATGLIQVSAYTMVGGINGHGYATISSCSVIGESGSYVKGIYLEEDLEGDNVGGIAGHIAESNTVADCKVTGITVEGTRKVGGIVGLANGGCLIQDAIVENVVVKCNASDAYLQENLAKIFVGGILGEYNGNVTVTGSIANVNVQGLEEKTGVAAGGSRQASAVLTKSVKIGDQVTVNNGTYAYNADKAMLYTEGEEVMLYSVKEYTGDTETFVVPEGVTVINASFSSMNPKKVVFADSVVAVGRVFDSCDNLTEVVLNEGLEIIGNRAFRRCYALTEITIPSTVTTIESGAFQSCTALKSAVIPTGVTEIGEQAFGDCAELETLILPEGLTTIGASMLRGSKVTEITIPSTVTSIGSMALRDNYYLVDVHVKCATVPTIGSNAFLRASEATPAGKYRLRTYHFYNTEVYEALKNNIPGEFNTNANYSKFVNKAPVIETPSSSADFQGALGDGTGNIVIDATGSEEVFNSNEFIPEGERAANLYGGTTVNGATIQSNSGNGTFLVKDGEASSEITFKDCTFKTTDFTNKSYLQVDSDAVVKVVFNNCTFEGQIIVAGWSLDTVFEFNNCEFTLGSGTGYVQCMGGTTYFNGCTFNYAGGNNRFDNAITKYNKINLYCENYSTVVYFDNCTGVSTYTSDNGSGSCIIYN